MAKQWHLELPNTSTRLDHVLHVACLDWLDERPFDRCQARQSSSRLQTRPLAGTRKRVRNAWTAQAGRAGSKGGRVGSVSDDSDNAAGFRAAIAEAKDRQPKVERGTSADYDSNLRRTGKVKTSNYLLYMSLDDKTLRTAAEKGDEDTVTRILQVKDGCDDPEAMVAAARGGHEVVIQLLLALGGANPDPAPISSQPPEFATPMLAAIGQENIKVVRLLLDQLNFDPTRRFEGETFYEIPRRRQGPNWREEEHMLREGHDAYVKSRHTARRRARRKWDRRVSGTETKNERPSVGFEAKEEVTTVSTPSTMKTWKAREDGMPRFPINLV